MEERLPITAATKPCYFLVLQPEFFQLNSFFITGLVGFEAARLVAANRYKKVKDDRQLDYKQTEK